MAEIILLQGTDEWRRARAGRVTASRIESVMRKLKSGGFSADRANYLAELLTERLTGQPAEHYVSAEMRWGIEHEDELFDAYGFRYDVEPVKVGFVPHPRIPMTGASPDRRVGDRGLAEGKCPNSATHLDYLLGEPIDRGYILQMQWQLACEERDWCDFVSYDPRMPEALRLFVKRIERDDVLIAEIEREVRRFLGELDSKLQNLNVLYGVKAAA